jgi:hypothetical protein
MTIELTPDLELALAKAAERQGTTPQVLALALLSEQLLDTDTVGPAAPEGATMADFLADHIGVLDSSEYISGMSDLSEETGRKFTATLLKRQQEGRL